MNIRSFFQGIFNFPIADEMIESALYMRTGHGDGSEDISILDTESRELMLADILIMLSRASQTWSNKTGSDAFSMILSGEIIPLADRQVMKAEANRIYRKYKEFESVTESNAINIY